MRKNLILLAGVGLLLAGCSSAEPLGEKTPTESAPQTSTATPWDGMTFCEILEDQRPAYQEALDSSEPIQVSELTDSFGEWSAVLKAQAPPEATEDVKVFTAPISMDESGNIDLIEVFGAGNNLGRHCALSG